MEHSKRNNEIMVSIVIPVHNEDVTKLQKYLHTVKGRFEAVVVKKGLERSAQRNIGIQSSRGTHVIIMDADQYPHPNLIKECIELFEQGYDALYIPEKIVTPGLFGYIRNWERQFYTGTPIDCVRAVKKPCPTFDETMSGPEDADWDRRVKGKRAVTKSCFYHYDNIGVIEYFRKKAYYSKSMGLFHVKHPKDKVLDWKWRCFGAFFEQGKWKRVLKRPDLFMCVMLIILIRGIIYVKARKAEVSKS